MIGISFIKPVSDWSAYAEAADWCNTNGAVIREYPDRYEVEAIPAPTFAEKREAKLAELSASFDAHVSGSTFIATTDTTYLMQFDRSDSLAVEGMIRLLEATGQETGYLTQADDVTVYDIPLAEIKQVLIGMLSAYARAHAKKQAYRSQIAEAKTAEELDGIAFDWEV